MRGKVYDTYRPSPGDAYSPYKGMAEGVYGKDTSITTSTCPTAEEIDWSKRVVNLDQGPRPKYYGGVDNPYEVFEVLEAWGLDKDFYLGNVIKYVARAGKKNKLTEKEDLQKALVYLQKRIDSL
jgi:hypothetical protein